MFRTTIILAILLACTGCAELSASRAQAQNAVSDANQASNNQSDPSQSSTSSSSTKAGSFLVPDDISNNQASMIQDSSISTNSASHDLEIARMELEKGNYPPAIQAAVSSYTQSPSDEARTILTYAASQLTPIEIMRLESNATTHIEQAVFGQLRLNVCIAQKDQVCIQELLPKTMQSLEMIGDAEAAAMLGKFNPAAASNQPVVAVLLPLSGNDRKIGRAMLGSMLQASGVYTHQQLPFALRFFDTQTSQNTINSILAETKKYNVRLVLGPLDIRESIAAAQNLTDQVMIGFSPNDEFIKKTPNAFQISYTIPEEAQEISRFLVTLNAGTILSVSPEDAYARTIFEQIKTNLSASQTMTALTYPSSQTDLRDIAQKAAKTHPDVIFLPTGAETAERIMSFMAQENLWCKTPGTPAPKSSADTRKFVTCLSSSVWSPMNADHHYKFIVDAIYLDYTDSALSASPDFAKTFESLYHRQPSVQEVLPFLAISMLKDIPGNAWHSTASLLQSVQSMFKGQQYIIIPTLRQVTADSTRPYTPNTPSAQMPSRTIVTTK